MALGQYMLAGGGHICQNGFEPRGPLVRLGTKRCGNKEKLRNPKPIPSRLRVFHVVHETIVGFQMLLRLEWGKNKITPTLIEMIDRV